MRTTKNKEKNNVFENIQNYKNENFVDNYLRV